MRLKNEMRVQNKHLISDMMWILLVLFIESQNFLLFIVRPANREWACQTERCHTLSNKTSLQ